MSIRKSLMAAATLALAIPASAAPHGVKIGQLLCHVDGGWGYVLGSSKDLKCSYHPNHGVDDFYEGSINKFGLDIGYTSSGTLVWDVIAPTSDMRGGALAGDYAGATASATVAVGLGAHVLLGGFDRSIALQPVSFESNSGLNVAAGVGELSLRSSPPPPAMISQGSPPALARRFVVTFDFDNARLSADARDVIADAATMGRRDRPGRIVVVGSADSVGDHDYNAALSLRRAEEVKKELARNGVDPDRVEVAGRGTHDPVVPTEPGVHERLNRRVVIEWQDQRPERQASR